MDDSDNLSSKIRSNYLRDANPKKQQISRKISKKQSVYSAVSEESKDFDDADLNEKDIDDGPLTFPPIKEI